MQNSKEAGVALMEVLIAMVVIAFGLLGLAGLQVTGLRNNHSAYMRSIATQQAYDITERMRANHDGVLAGDYNAISGTPADPGCIGSNCTSSQLAQFDAHQWNTDNARLLPSGQGVVCLDDTPNDGNTAASPDCSGSGNIFVVKIWWDDEKTPASPKRFSTSFKP